MLSSTLDVPDIPSWLVLRIGTDDLPDAYRGLPVREEHLPYSVVAVYVGSVGWRFTVLHGLAYGLESAVVAFNRFPSLGIGIARRCALALGAAYFDDQLAWEVITDADVSQRGIQLVFQLMGAPPQPAKSFLQQLIDTTWAPQFILLTSPMVVLFGSNQRLPPKPKFCPSSRTRLRKDSFSR